MVGVRGVVELLDVQRIVLKLQNCALVVVAVAVVGSREDRNHCREPRPRVGLVHFVPFQLGLVGPDDREQLVLLEEHSSRLTPEEERTPADVVGKKRSHLRDVIFLLFICGVAPENVTEKSISGRFHESVDRRQLRHRPQIGRQPSMDPQKLSVDCGSNRKGVKAVHEGVVDVQVVFVFAFVSEVEERSHLSAFVISPQQPDAGGEVQLQSTKKDDALDRKRATIHIVTQEKILRVLRRSSHIQQLHEIVELSVDVPNDGDWVSEFENVSL
mmetsp:Transcript_19137/g.38634  ORF Transcript_19137/g.38634 Transcript_19137/m.38634 type:complete len:271 (+) Transcript_19137:1903-2715(+)